MNKKRSESFHAIAVLGAMLISACSDIRFADHQASGNTERTTVRQNGNLHTAAFTSTGAGEPLFFDRGQLIPDSIRYETFTFVRETLRSQYFDTTFSGIDWDSLCSSYLPRVEQETESGAFHSLLNEMINRLGRSHLRITPPHIQASEKAVKRTFTVDGLDIRRVGDRQMVTYVAPRSEAWERGVSAGDIVVAVDSIPAGDNQASRLIRGDSASTCRIVYLNSENRENEVDLPRTSRVIPTMERLTRAKVDHRRLDDDIGYIHIDMWGVNLAPQLEYAFRDLKDTRALIVDVRQNPGGIGSDCLTRHIYADSTVTGFQVFNHGVNITLMSGGSGDQAYTGKIAILIDSRSGSSSELLAANLQESGRALLIGEKSYGGVLNATQTLLPSGGSMLYPNAAMYTAGGNLLEDRGVTPDYTVKLKREDLYKGIDTVIETAKDILKNALG